MKVPIITGKKIILRPKEIKDAVLLAKWLKDKEVMKYFSHNFYGSTKKQEEDFIKDLNNKDNKFINFAIVLKDTGKMIGDVGAEILPFNGTADMWILIGDKSEWGKGYGTESMLLFLNYYFDDLQLNRMEIEVTEEYERGIKIYEKIGFVKEGIKRQGEWDCFDNKHKNLVIMSILYDDWFKDK